MKFNKIFFGLACLATLSFTACEDTDKDFSDSKTPKDGVSATAVEFASGNKTTFELDPSSPNFSLTVQRKATDAASYEVKVVTNEANSFEVPSTIAFAAGEKTAVLPIAMKDDAAQGTPLKLSLTFNSADLDPYTSGLKSIDVKATIIKWENVGVGYWFGNIINTFFGVDPQLLAVGLERAETAAEIKYRFESPYAHTYTMQDELGAFDGYPYNDASDLNGVVENFVFSINKTSKAVTLASAPINLGINYGYGDFMFTAASTATGIYTPSENGGIIKFAESTFGLGMTEYNDGKYYPCGECTLFLSAADYKAAMKYEADVETDFEFEEVFSGEFKSGLLGKASESALYVGTCTETTDDCDKVFEATYGTLYMLVSPYAEDYNLTFCVKDDVISVPGKAYTMQPTGLTALGKDVYAKINSKGSSLVEDELVLNITFTDASGSIVYGTTEEVLQNVKWNSIGTGMFTDAFVAPLFVGDAPTYEVEVLECENKPGLYRVMNPYSNSVYPYAEDDCAEEGLYLQIDATDPDAVMIEQQELGFDWGYGPFAVVSYGVYMMMMQKYDFATLKAAGFFGTLEDGVITLPEFESSNGVAYTSILYVGDGGYYAGAGFQLVLPAAAKEVAKYAPAKKASEKTFCGNLYQNAMRTIFSVNKSGKTPAVKNTKNSTAFQIKAPKF